MMKETVSRIGRPKETIGIATATIVGAFCAPSRAMSTQQESDEEAAGVSQKNRGGIEVEAEEPEDRAGEGDRHEFDERLTVQSATTNTTMVENSAEPAARPSSPSIKLKALVIARTQRTVKDEADIRRQR